MTTKANIKITEHDTHAEEVQIRQTRNYLHSHEIPQYVIDTFNHLHKMRCILEDAALISTQKWQEAQDEIERLRGALDTMVEQLSFYVPISGRDGQNGAGV